MSKSFENKILVTGAAGMIGSAVVWKLNTLGFENIIVCDTMPSDCRWRNLVPLRFLDFVDSRDLIEFAQSSRFSEMGCVFHLGACSSTTEKDVGFLLRNNFQFTKELAIASLRVGARFVYASSAATYGNGDQGMSDAEVELEKFRPLNPYGYSKQLFDVWSKRNGILDKITGIKYFNVFGPNENHKAEMRSVVAKGFDEINETGLLRLFRSYRPEYADGEQARDFVYLKDAVSATIHLAQDPDATGLFNIGTGKARTWNDLASALFSSMEKEMNIEYIDMPSQLIPQYQYHTLAETEKLLGSGYDSGFRPLEDSVDDYVRGYLLSGKRLGE